MKHLFCVLIVLSVCQSACFSAWAESLRRLGGSEIAVRFKGKEFTDQVHWALTFDKGGRLNSFSMGRASTGRWRIEKDELCLDRENNDSRCYEVWASGGTVQLRREPELPEEGILQKSH